MPKVTAIATAVLLLAACVYGQASTDSAKPVANIQPTKSPADKEGNNQNVVQKQLALDLLNRSYALNEQVKEERRLGLMNTQISVASRLDKDLARKWAHELFDLGAKSQSRNSTTAQFMAINALSLQDPEEALGMLALLEPASLAPEVTEFPGANIAVMTPRNIFTALARKEGKKAMPRILATANGLGDKGRYPYAGMMAAAVETKDEAVIENTANRLMARFQQGVDPAAVSFDFAEMLSISEGHWPKELLKPAVDLAVESVQKYPVSDENKNLELTVRTSQSSATARGPVEMGLLRMASLIKKGDPDLWLQLNKTYPNLSTAPERGPGSGITSMTMSFGGGSSSAAHVNSAEEQKRQTLMEIRQLVWTDLDKAEKTISAIADPAIRSEALTYAAQAASHKNPEKSAVFAAEAEKAAAQVDNPIVRFQSACARLHSDAMNKDHEATVEGLEKTFQLADKVMRKTRDDGKETSFLIMPLVEAVNEAVKVEPELTVAHIESVYLAFEKAQLLTSAASALASAPRPIRSPAPNPDSQDKQEN